MYLPRRWTRASSITGFVLAVAAAGVVTAPAPAHARSRCENGYVALTFDDGPNPKNTMSLLAALRKAGLRATMFNVGVDVERYPELVQAEVEAGFWIGNHSYSHPHLTHLNRWEIEWELSETQHVIEEATGVVPKVFRAPYVESNDQVRTIANALGLTQVAMGVDGGDWRGATTEEIIKAARRLKGGGVMVMHDRTQRTVAAIPSIADDLRARGLCTGTLSDTDGTAVAP